MKVSMNGLRRSLSNDVETLKELVEKVSGGTESSKHALVLAMNDVITASNVLNCVYSPDDPDFSDLSDMTVEQIDIKHGSDQ